MTCPNCGENMLGDGYRVPLHCPNADEDDWFHAEPDIEPIYCPLVYVSEWKARRPELTSGPPDR
jgi:uncharacterized protein (DUF983 family)